MGQDRKTQHSSPLRVYLVTILGIAFPPPFSTARFQSLLADVKNRECVASEMLYEFVGTVEAEKGMMRLIGRVEGEGEVKAL